MKKHLIRTLSLIIAVLIVAMSMPLGVFAATDSLPSINGTLCTGCENYIYYYYNTPEYYKFVPEEDDLYQFYSTGETDTFATVFDSDMNMLDSDDDNGEKGNFKINISLVKNKTYILKVGAYGSGDFAIGVRRPEDASSVTICDKNQIAVESIYGHTGESKRFFAQFAPENSVGEDFVWETEDENVAEVDKYGNLTFKNAGETTLTVVSGSLTSSVKVSVSDKVYLLEDEEKVLLIPDTGDHFCMEFIGPKSGYYRFTYSDYEDIEISVFDVYGENLFANVDISAGFDVYLEEGETLKLYIDYAKCSAENFTIKAEHIVYANDFLVYAEVDGVRYEDSFYQVYEGESVQFGVEALPEGAIFGGEVIFSSEGYDFGSIDGSGSFMAVTPGYFEFTVSCNGMEKRVAVNVLEKETITFDSNYSTDLCSYNLGKYIATFNLQEGKDKYSVIYTTDEDVDIFIRDENGIIYGRSSGTKGVLSVNLYEDCDYEIVAVSSNPDNIVYFYYELKTFVPANDIKILDSEGNINYQYDVEVGDSFTLIGRMEPEQTDATVIWESTNPNVAFVDEYGNVTIHHGGDAYIRAYTTNSNGETNYDFWNEVYIYARKITDVQFGETKSIYIEETFEDTEKLRLRPTVTGYYSVYVSGNSDYPNISLVSVIDNMGVDIEYNWISDTEYRYAFYLEKDKEYILSFGGTTNEWYTVSLEEYDVPSEIFICDTNGTRLESCTVYAGESKWFELDYGEGNFFEESGIWSISPSENATVSPHGYVEFHKSGEVTLTATLKSGLEATLKINVTDGEEIELDTTVNKDLSPNGNNQVKFIFTPEVTGVYEIIGKNNTYAYSNINWYITDAEYNYLEPIYNSSLKCRAKFIAGETYYIKAQDHSEGGNYDFVLTNLTIGLNSSIDLYMPEGSDERLNYCFIPEKDGFYLFETSGYDDDGWGRGVELYDENGHYISGFDIDGNSSKTYAKLEAGRVYNAEIIKNYYEAASFTFTISETIGIESLEIISGPDDTTFIPYIGRYDLEGLSLKATLSDGTSQTWNYGESENIAGFIYGERSSPIQDGKIYVTISFGGARCNLVFAEKVLENLYLDSPVSITFGEEFDEIYYTFIPEESGWYSFKGYDYTTGYQDRYMDIFLGSENVYGAYEYSDAIEMIAYLEKGNTYIFNTYKHDHNPDSFSLCVSETVAITSLEILTPPTDATIVEGTTNYSLEGLSLKANLSDGTSQTWNYGESDKIAGFTYSEGYSDEENGIRYIYIEVAGISCPIPLTVKKPDSIKVNTPLNVEFGEEFDEIYYTFIPEKSGYYLFKSFDHEVESTGRYMSLYKEDEFVASSRNDWEVVEMRAYLTAGEEYTLNVYKYYFDSDTFTLLVTETVAVESISIKEYPQNMTVYEGSEYNYDFSGMVLSVTTSDGQTRDWTYNPNDERVFGFLTEVDWSSENESVRYWVYIDSEYVTLEFEIVEYPLESIEVITIGDLVFDEHTNGFFMNETDYYYDIDLIVHSELMVKLNYYDGSYRYAYMYENIDNFMVDCYENQWDDPWTVGSDNYFTVCFANKEVRVPVTILPVNDIVKLEVAEAGNISVIEGNGYCARVSETDYAWIYNIDLSSVKFKATFEDGTETIISTDVRYFDYERDQFENPLVVGENQLTVYYDDLSVVVPVTVIENDIQSIEVAKTPTYIYGDESCGEFDEDGNYHLFLNFESGFEISVTYKDGTQKIFTYEDLDERYNEIEESEIRLGLYDSNVVVGNNKAFLAWKGQKVDFDIKVVEPLVESIEVVTLPEFDENLKYCAYMDGLEIKITYTDSTSKTVTFTKEDFTTQFGYGVTYVAQVDGEELRICFEGGSGYRIEYRGATTLFSIGEEYGFDLYPWEILCYDKINNTVTILVDYYDYNLDEYFEESITLQIGEFTVREYEDLLIKEYAGVYEGVGGTFTYQFEVLKFADVVLPEYSISMFADGTTRMAYELMVDINGDGMADARDIVAFKKYLATAENQINCDADYDGDGNVTVSDLIWMRRAILGDVNLSIVDGDADGDGYVWKEDALLIALNLDMAKEDLEDRADINGDGITNAVDTVVLAKLIENNSKDLSGDFNGDGKVSADDLTCLKAYFLGNVKFGLVFDKSYMTFDDEVLTYFFSGGEPMSNKSDVNRDGVIDSEDLYLIKELCN